MPPVGTNVATGSISLPCEVCGRRWALKAAEQTRLCPECKLANSDRPTRKQLMQAITAAFEEPVIRSFLICLASRNARIRVIEEASSELDRHLLPMQGVVREDGFLVLFDDLDDVARYAVFDFYAAKIDSVDRGLRKEFARVFRQ
jgi:hypothetical protein